MVVVMVVVVQIYGVREACEGGFGDRRMGGVFVQRVLE